jgi:glycine/sarcosine N-methyltransferase
MGEGRHMERGADSGPSPAAFYDGLAPHYDRLYEDWDAAVSEQARVLNLLLEGRLGAGPRRILDCAVGVGTQTLGLLQLGHEVWGTDVSSGAVERTRSECQQRKLATAGLGVADMRMLPFSTDCFDAVICADNAVAHLLSLDDVETALREMARVTRPGGSILASTRDYESARRTRPPGTIPQTNRTLDEHTIAFQTWTWRADECSYDLQHFFLIHRDDAWEVTERSSTLYAITGVELVECARRAGLRGIDWRLPADTGFFQPVVIATVGS